MKCLCGCNKQVNEGKRYIHGHNTKGKKMIYSEAGLISKREEGIKLNERNKRNPNHQKMMEENWNKTVRKWKGSSHPLFNKVVPISRIKKRLNTIKERFPNWGDFIKGYRWSEEAKKKVSGKNSHRYGKKPWNYIDGRSKTKSPMRYGDDWEKIRYLVYLRDKFTCQNCDIKGISLDVHHKVPFLISFDNSLSNLISLCRSCHVKEESRIMKKLKNMEVA